MADGWYTYGTRAVYDAAPGADDKLVTGGTGGKFVFEKDGPAQPIRDLNGTPIAEITSNADGQSSQFQAQARRGLIQFGDLVVTVWGDEVADELGSVSDAVSAAQAAVVAAQEAVAEAQAALALAQQGGGGSGAGGGLPSGTTLEDIPNGVSRIAMTQAERDQLAKLPTTFLKVGPAATDAKPGNYVPTAKDIHAIEAMGVTDARMWLGRTLTQGPPTEAEGAKRGDYALLDVNI